MSNENLPELSPAVRADVEAVLAEYGDAPHDCPLVVEVLTWAEYRWALMGRLRAFAAADASADPEAADALHDRLVAAMADERDARPTWARA